MSKYRLKSIPKTEEQVPFVVNSTQSLADNYFVPLPCTIYPLVGYDDNIYISLVNSSDTYYYYGNQAIINMPNGHIPNMVNHLVLGTSLSLSLNDILNSHFTRYLPNYQPTFYSLDLSTHNYSFQYIDNPISRTYLIYSDTGNSYPVAGFLLTLCFFTVSQIYSSRYKIEKPSILLGSSDSNQFKDVKAFLPSSGTIDYSHYSTTEDVFPTADFNLDYLHVLENLH